MSRSRAGARASCRARRCETWGAGFRSDSFPKKRKRKRKTLGLPSPRFSPAQRPTRTTLRPIRCLPYPIAYRWTRAAGEAPPRNGDSLSLDSAWSARCLPTLSLDERQLSWPRRLLLSSRGAGRRIASPARVRVPHGGELYGGTQRAGYTAGTARHMIYSGAIRTQRDPIYKKNSRDQSPERTSSLSGSARSLAVSPSTQ